MGDIILKPKINTFICTGSKIYLYYIEFNYLIFIFINILFTLLIIENISITIYRGTNKNESLHRKLNQMFPEKCGKELSTKVIKSFIFHWNNKRSLHTDELINIHSSERKIYNSTGLGLIDLIKKFNKLGGIIKHTNC